MSIALVRRLALLALLVGCGKTKVTPPDPIVWHTLAEGEALARAQHRPAILYFHADWSTAEKELEETTFPDPTVRAEMARYVAIQIDVTDDELPGLSKIKDRFGMVGDPYILGVTDFDAWDAHPGRYNERVPAELFRFNEYVKPFELATRIHDASKRYDAMQAAKP